jgi:photosystem II stability/assembly factor-like uncharacterized protein
MGRRHIGLGVVLLTSCWSAAAIAQPTEAAASGWHDSRTEAYKGKRDDIHFATAKIGFYGTGAGDFFRTEDGGASWAKIWSKPGTFIRAIGFIDATTGFFGNVGDYYPNVTDKVPLYRTGDGGRSWSPVVVPGADVEGICAIDILRTTAIHQGQLRERVVVHAAGRVGGPAKLLRSTDGGKSWRLIDLSRQAGMILDVKFLDPQIGLVFAGSNSDIQQSEALILKTRDGGRTWREVYRSGRKLENSWKASFADARTGYATVQTYDPERQQQVVVKTVDGGDSWREMPLVSNAKARQFGVGFLTANHGWVGTAAGGFETRDGGRSWAAAPLAPAANKIRTHAADGTPMVYAIGTKVQFAGRLAQPSDQRVSLR